ncbi:MAG: protease-4 [Myxococcota bacterium]|jgi:protease-4
MPSAMSRTIGLLALFLSPTAYGWDPVLERPDTPSLSAAGEDGAMSMWRNPANLAFDPDRSYAVLYSQALNDSSNTGISGVTNRGPVGLGFAYRGGLDTASWWTLSSGFGVMLDRNLALGVHMGWQIPDGADNNFVTWDLGLGWRPTSWLGFAGIAQNVGDPAPDIGIEERYGGGVVLRPWGDRLLLGADYLFTGIFERQNGQTIAEPEGLLEGSVRFVPVKGLTLRGYANQEGVIGGGLEVFWGASGLGASAQTSGSDPASSPTALLYATSSSDGEQLFGSDKRVVVFDLDESFPYQPASGLFASSSESYIDLLNRLKKAAEDPSIKGMLIHLETTPFSLAQVEELRTLISEARTRGKTVAVYMDRSTGNSAYLLACAADRVYLHPAGELDLIGLSAEMQFLAGTFDLLGIEPQFVKRAEYKSSPERFTHTESSQASREQMNALVDDMFTTLTEGIAEGRSRSVEQVVKLIDQGPFTGAEALERDLVDGLLYPDQLEEELDNLFSDGHILDEDYGLESDVSGWRARNEIAVVYVEGVIVSGTSQAPGFLSSGRSAGSETIVAQLNQARKDASVKAVVLRVDSPGGSAFASDDIWRAVERIKEKGKPVIVSMGGTAASGGYYVAAGATAIYASPSTITGSIGVYSGKYSVEGLYERIGINVEQYTRGRNAALYSLSTPLDESEYAAMDRMVEDIYRQFKDKVADGRGMSQETVEQVARGRVWSGIDALEQGLIDELGGFHDAVARARLEAEIPERAEVSLIQYSPRASSEGAVLRSTIQAALLPRLDILPPQAELLLQWQQLSEDPVWAVMPYTLEIH